MYSFSLEAARLPNNGDRRVVVAKPRPDIRVTQHLGIIPSRGLLRGK